MGRWGLLDEKKRAPAGPTRTRLFHLPRRQARPGGLGLRSRPPGGALSPLSCSNGCPLCARQAGHHPARRRALHYRVTRGADKWAIRA